MVTNVPVITIDGPSGVGKGTLCKELSKELKWNILDSGAIYRVLAFLAIRDQININSKDSLIQLVSHLVNLHFIFENNKMKIILKKTDISMDIRNQKISDVASRIALLPCLRKAILNFQRSFRLLPGLIAEGRDMGTIIFPDALVKIFLDANTKTRTKRRMLQLQKNGVNVNFDQLLLQIQERDKRDYHRVVSPLIIADDVFIINSTHMSKQKVMEAALHYTYLKLTRA
ncbi:(d)CMP kinase [Candidatus Erwinia haradaeae]|uniref:Cytidylate kinase n=1 Tax=Candidatus Erwinia haradaeae TaxID=1922217 RepID=A0A451D3V5_9GAMM|nr:(d)CMP kinase [Candidatus Erwinia haradaeae]VFP80337.1 Cytidylate kinase [Candidatus Erwinia haradaeae]